MLRLTAADLWMLNMSAQFKWMRNTPGLTARSNPRLSLADQSRNREKLAEERGLFDSGGGLWSSVAVQTHTYLFIKSLAQTSSQTQIGHITVKIVTARRCMFQTEAHSSPRERQTIAADLCHQHTDPTPTCTTGTPSICFFFCLFLSSISLTLSARVALLAS